jgi:acetyl-CoA carboxylase biotin carboxyl carrier protein
MKKLPALVRHKDDGQIQLCAPKLGTWRDAPQQLDILLAGRSLGVLKVLNTRYEIVVPATGQGTVQGDFPKGVTPVEYGQPLITVGGDEALQQIAGEFFSALDSRAEMTGLVEGDIDVRAPLDGIFYSRPGPDSPNFVTEGDVVELGQTLGLIEVMKTFNPIRYTGDGRSQEATVHEIRVLDAQEVSANEILMVLKPFYVGEAEEE